MVAAVHDLLEALSSMGVTIEAHGDSLRYRPASALTPELLSAVKSCKAGLLEILQSSSLFSNGSDVGGQCAAGVRAALSPDSIPQSRCDAEFDRFAAIAEPLSDGSGWFDPAFGPDLPRGITGEQWDAFLADFTHLGKVVRT